MAGGFSWNQQFFGEVDAMTLSFASSTSQIVATVITPVVGALLTLTMIIYIIMIAVGEIDRPVSGLLKRYLLISFVAAFALTSGIYQAHYAQLIVGLGDDIAQRFSGMQAGSAASIIDAMAQKGLMHANKAFAEASVWDAGYYLLGSVIGFTTIMISGIGMSALLVTKVGLAILAALGPAFIATLLFPMFRDMFARWLAQVFNYWLIIVVVGMVFNYLIHMFDRTYDSMRVDGTQNMWFSIAAVALLGIAACVVLWQAYKIASIVGGVTLERTNFRPRPRPRPRIAKK